MENENEFKKDVIRKPVAFNTKDHHQRELLRYAIGLDNYSGHMRRLLAEDYRKHRQLQKLIAQQEAKTVHRKFKDSGSISFKLED
jgi:hypothetical protein